MENNIIIVTAPTFFVLIMDPTQVSYEHRDSKLWKFVQVGHFHHDPTVTGSDYLYIYEKKNDAKSFMGALLTPSHFGI